MGIKPSDIRDIKVSIIIPVYNREKYISQCLDSVLKQTLKNIEIICVDDGSVDRTADILEQYSLIDDRVKVIHKPNSGYGNSMNVGIKAAAGEYIGIVESDDYIEENMYEKLYDIAEEDNADVVKADFYVFYDEYDYERTFSILSENNKELYNRKVNYIEDWRTFEAYMTSWSGIYKRSFLEENGILHNETPGASFQDNGFWLQTMLYARKVVFINQPFYHLRRDNSDSSVYSLEKIFALCDEYEFMRGCIKRYGRDLDRLLPWIWDRRFRACISDMTRISYDARYDLLKRLAGDMGEGIKTKELSKETATEYTWNRVANLIDDPYAFFIKYFRICDEAVERLDVADGIAVYGAGNYATTVLGDIQTSRFVEKLLGIVVSNTEGNPYIKSRLRVRQIEKGIFPKNTLFIISMRQGIEEARQKLVDCGYDNMISCYELHDML